MPMFYLVPDIESFYFLVNVFPQEQYEQQEDEPEEQQAGLRVPEPGTAPAPGPLEDDHPEPFPTEPLLQRHRRPAPVRRRRRSPPTPTVPAAEVLRPPGADPDRTTGPATATFQAQLQGDLNERKRSKKIKVERTNV